MVAKTEGTAMGPPVAASRHTRFSACKKLPSITPDTLPTTAGGRDNFPTY